jgi:hypothetical protein
VLLLHLSAAFLPDAAQANERCAAYGVGAEPADVVEAVVVDKVVVAPEGHGRRRRGLWLAVVDDSNRSCVW